jgi:hypothetical protein
MHNIPQTSILVTCDFFLDALLVSVVRDQATIDCGDEARLVRLDRNEASVGMVGRLVVIYTPHGERWQFLPYKYQSWRRIPDLDTASTWGWRCKETGEWTKTVIGTVPDHAPTALSRADDADDLPLF